MSRKLLVWSFLATAIFIPSINSQASSTTYKPSLKIWCSQLVTDCLEKSQLPYTADGRCYKPLSRGPCKSEDFWFTVSERESEESGQLTGHCVLRPCHPGRYGLRGRCTSQKEASKELCGGHPVHPDLKGRFRCGNHTGWKIYLDNLDLPCRYVTHYGFSSHAASVEQAYDNNEEVAPEVTHQPSNRGSLLDVDD